MGNDVVAGSPRLRRHHSRRGRTDNPRLPGREVEENRRDYNGVCRLLQHWSPHKYSCHNSEGGNTDSFGVQNSSSVKLHCSGPAVKQ
ncbi:hypothetical protein RRG08_027950 [Elysia crispata]|uniref:Uncharacterized protein n=1 Tax=Elysia crispata TaxID=231223 RepID=A0AAE0ZJV7_9GAST|nr:hypothetical protein RRG08_027950 [Elysia crispata]